MEMAAPKNTTPKEIAIRFLECIKLRDQDQMRAMYLPGATACLIRDGKPMYLLMDDILDKMNAASVSGLESEEVSYDEIEHVDGDFATVWTPFKFYENGKLHHTGTNNFNFWKSPDKGWLITAVQDIARNEKWVTAASWGDI